MGTAGLDRAIARGAPLVEIVVRFHDGADYVAAARVFNALGDDLDLYAGDWYGDPALRIGWTTKEALERLFGWRLVRVPLERFDESSGDWGTWPDTFRWEEVGQIERMPPPLVDVVKSISISQPGHGDEGQWYE